MNRKRLKSEAGASAISYAMIVAIMVPMFIIAGTLLSTSSKHRGDAAIGSSEYMIPCGGKLSASECL